MDMRYICMTAEANTLEELDKRVMSILNECNDLGGECISISHQSRPNYNAILILKVPKKKKD